MNPQNNFGLTAGYFGKLPKYLDFIKYNAGGEEILSIDKWIQDGITLARGKLKSEWKAYYKQSPGLNFFYPDTNTKNALAGVIFPSNDKSEREFPFILFLNLNTNFLNGIPAHLIPLFFYESFNSFRLLYKESSLIKTLDLLNNEVQKISSQISMNNPNLKYQEYLTSTTQKIFWERTLNDFNHPVKFAIVNNLIKNLSWMKFNSHLIFPFGIKISFRTSEEYSNYDLGFFIQLILIIVNKPLYIPSFFWTQQDNNIDLYVFLNKPTSLQYVDLILKDESGARVLKVEKFEDKIQLLNSIPSAYKKLLENDKLSLMKFFQTIQQ
ncbi:MAG: type VI secretion system-associated protein TagF [Ignavibacteriales bacterium]|nr:type VI secretion system-associated protein TagF [Ignavibacteriales bacterium]